jgi:hypothetical protein
MTAQVLFTPVGAAEGEIILTTVFSLLGCLMSAAAVVLICIFFICRKTVRRKVYIAPQLDENTSLSPPGTDRIVSRVSSSMTNTSKTISHITDANYIPETRYPCSASILPTRYTHQKLGGIVKASPTHNLTLQDVGAEPV